MAENATTTKQETKPAAENATTKLGKAKDALYALVKEHKTTEFGETGYEECKDWHDRIFAAIEEHLADGTHDFRVKVCDKWVIGPKLKAMHPLHFNNFKREACKYLEERIETLREKDLA